MRFGSRTHVASFYPDQRCHRSNLEPWPTLLVTILSRLLCTPYSFFLPICFAFSTSSMTLSAESSLDDQAWSKCKSQRPAKMTACATLAANKLALAFVHGAENMAFLSLAIHYRRYCGRCSDAPIPASSPLDTYSVMSLSIIDGADGPHSALSSSRAADHV